MHPVARNPSSLVALAARAMFAFTLWMACCAGAAAGEASSTDVVIAALKGEVHVSMSGIERTVREGTVVELPASVRTGANSSIELHQGATIVKVAADSQIDIPETAARGELLDKVLQPRGNAFYSVAKRTAKKLRVETPFLVAVIKGTQFNVAVQDEMATIALYEGKLEIRATDGSDVTDLNAGEIAIRHSGDKAIRVIRMDNGQPVLRPHGDDRAALPVTGGSDSGGGIPTPTPVDRAQDNLPIGVTPIGVNANGGVTVSTADGAVATGVDVDASIGRSALGVKADVAVDAGGASVAADANVGTSLGAVTADVGASTAVDVGTSGVAASVDTSTSVGVGGASIDVGTGSNVSVGSTGVDLGTSAAASTPVAGVGVDASVSTTTPSVAVDTGVTTPVANIGVDLNLGASTPVVDISITTPTTGTGTTDTGNADTGGLIGRVGGLLGHN